MYVALFSNQHYGTEYCWYTMHLIFQINSVEVVAVVNDAVGTLMSAAHSDRQCEIGLILGP